MPRGVRVRRGRPLGGARPYLHIEWQARDLIATLCGMAQAIDIARYLLWLAQSEAEPEVVTPMRLQKLLYYAQGWSIAVRGEPLFEGQIQAWTHGPVVREVYAVFADYGDREIPPHEARDSGAFDCDHAEFVAWVWDEYKRFSASELRRKTHNESPWIDARQGLQPEDRGNREVTVESMRRFFSTLHERIVHPSATIQRLRQAAGNVAAGRGARLSEVRERVLRDRPVPGG